MSNTHPLAYPYETSTPPQGRGRVKITRRLPDPLLSKALSPAERLRNLRQAKGFTSASAAARALKVVTVTYCSHEAGSARMSPEVAKMYADFYGVRPDVILYGDDLVIYPSALPQVSSASHEIIGHVVSPQGYIRKFHQDPRQRSYLQGSYPYQGILQAVRIDTDGMKPAYYRGDFVLFDKLTKPLKPDLVAGHDVVLTTTHARKMLTFLERTADGGWELQTPNQPKVQRQVYLASRVRFIWRV